MDKARALTDAELFVAVADEAGFTPAARRLDIAQSTLSRRIEALEQRLRTRLLTRTTRQVVLTDVGRVYLDKCRAVVALLREAEQSISVHTMEPEGMLRITAPTALGRTRIADLVTQFMKRHRRLEVDLVLVDRYVSLLEEGFDVGVRVGQLRDSALLSRRLTALPMVVCAAPAYFAERPAPRHPGDLAQHDCILFRGAGTYTRWKFSDGTTQLSVPVSGRLTLNDTMATYAAALAGGGITRLPRLMVEDDLKSGALVAALEDWGQPERPISLVYPAGRQSVPKVKAFVSFMVAEFGL